MRDADRRLPAFGEMLGDQAAVTEMGLGLAAKEAGTVEFGRAQPFVDAPRRHQRAKPVGIAGPIELAFAGNAANTSGLGASIGSSA